MADLNTKLSDLIDPEVMGDMVSARIPKKLRVAPFAKIDDTLAGVPGDTITVPAYTYIGDAADVAEGANVYFTHSYALEDDAEPALVAARTFYARAIPAVIARGNLFGCQFHPEKSSAHGQQILKNFVAICARARSASAHGDGAALDVARRAAPASQEVSA